MDTWCRVTVKLSGQLQWNLVDSYGGTQWTVAWNLVDSCGRTQWTVVVELGRQL